MPTCVAVNSCSITLAAVPAGHVLRVSRIFGILFTLGPGFDGFAMLRMDKPGVPTVHLLAFSVTATSGAYYGSLIHL